MKTVINKPERLILAGYMGIWLVTAFFTIPKLYGLTILPDEFGYMAHAAHLAGMDWKAVNAQCSYYSFGYGILIFPFMKLAPDGIALYRCMAGVNFFLMGIATLMLYRLLKRCFAYMKRGIPALASGAAAFYVAYITYSQTAMAEILLTFLYVLLAYEMYCWFQKPCIKRGCLLLITAGYMYTVHLRTIGIFLSVIVCMTAAVCFDKNGEKKGKCILVFVFLSAALFLLAGFIKGNLIQNVGSEIYNRIAAANNYSGQWGKLQRLLSLRGLGQFLTGLAGKLFYLGCASFGLYYWGMFWIIRNVKEGVRKFYRRQDIHAADWWYLWLFLSHTAALFISTVYCMGSGSRMDVILYGRYHENTIPCILALGIVELLEKPGGKKRLLWLAGLTGAGFFTVSGVLAEGNAVSVARQSITGILYALVRAGYYDTKTILYAYLISGAGSLAVLGLARLAGSGKQRYGLLLGISLLQLAAAFEAGRCLTIPSEGKTADAKLMNQTRQLVQGKGETQVFYLYRGKSKLLYQVQYFLQDITVVLISEEELQENYGEFLIVPGNYEEKKKIPEGYSKIAVSPSYELYYAPGSM